VWTTFTTANGLTANPVVAVVETDTNSVVVALERDVLVNDGIRFKSLLDAHPTFPRPMAPDRFLCAALGADGSVWLGTFASGVFRITPTDFRQFTPSDGLGDRRVAWVRSVLAEPDGTVWAATNGGGLSRFDGSQWTTLTTAQGLNSMFLSDLARDEAGDLWITSDESTRGGLFRYDGASFTTFVRPGGVTRNRLQAVTVRSDGELWVVSSDSGVGVFDATGNWLRDYVAELVSTSLADVTEGAHGEMWIASSSAGIQAWNGIVWDHYSSSNGLADNNTRSLVVDRAGTLWAGTQGGLSRYEGSQWLAFAATRGLPGSGILDLSRGPQADLSPAPPYGVTKGPLYVATRGLSGGTGGLVRFAGLAATGISEEDLSPLTREASAVQAIPGGAWAAIHDSVPPPSGGLPLSTPVALEIQGTTVVHRDTFLTAQRLVAQSLEVDARGDLWMSTNGSQSGAPSLFRRSGGVWSPYDIAGFTPTWIEALAADPTGGLWVGAYTAPKVARIDAQAGSVQIYDASHGIPGPVSALLVAADGVLWIGTSAGLARFSGGAVNRVFRSADGLPSNVLTTISEDELGRIWVGTDAGIAVYDGTAWSPYGPSDGVPGGLVSALVADTAEAAVGTGASGMALFHMDRTPPRPVITAGPPPALGGRSTQLAFGGGDLDSQTDFLRFSWALDGELPRPFSDDATAVLSGLADGDHLFEVWARDRALNVSPAPARYAFAVDATPPQPILASPSFGQVVAGSVSIVGVMEDPRFEAYELAVRPVGDPGPWAALAAGTTPVPPGQPIATWDTEASPDGRFEIRLTVRDTLDLVGTDYVEVVVDNLAPSNDVTSPARVNNQNGGRVYTLGAEMEIYFPPQSLDQDRTISILAHGGTSALPPGASRRLSGWLVEPDGFQTKKQVTLTFSQAALDSLSKVWGGAGFAAAAAAATPATGLPIGVFRVLPDSSQVYLGGSLDAVKGTLTTTTNVLGLFLVYEGFFRSTATDGRNIDVQPRAFSPIGTTFDDRAAISFDLSNAGSVRVLIYDHLGRLVRRAFEGPLGPGRNVVYWDGRDAGGDVAPSGIYLVAVDAEGRVDTKSVAVVNR
jgi:ligand-binding sensor domain-containing protein